MYTIKKSVSITLDLPFGGLELINNIMYFNSHSRWHCEKSWKSVEKAWKKLKSEEKSCRTKRRKFNGFSECVLDGLRELENFQIKGSNKSNPRLRTWRKWFYVILKIENITWGIGASGVYYRSHFMGAQQTFWKYLCDMPINHVIRKL